MPDVLVIDHAYVKTVSVRDPGTIYIYLSNRGPSPVTLMSLTIDGVQFALERKKKAINLSSVIIGNIETPISEDILWTRVLPNRILPSGGNAEVTVKLSKRPNRPIDFTLSTLHGAKLKGHVSAVPNPLIFTAITFDRYLRTAYLYLENSGKRALNVSAVQLDSRDVMRMSIIPSRPILPGTITCITVQLHQALPRGEFVTFKVSTKQASIAESMVRAFSWFPIVLESGLSRRELLMDPSDLRIRDWRSWSDERHTKPFDAWCVMVCPAHIYGSLDYSYIGANEILYRERIVRMINSRPGIIHICRVDFLESCRRFGTIADIMRVNPCVGLLHSFPHRDMMSSGEYDVQVLTKLAKRASEPKIIHTVIPLSGSSKLNPNPSAELTRLLTYCAISRGSKGILYRSGDISWETQAGKQAYIRELNGELQILKRFLRISEVVPGGRVQQKGAEACTLLAGNKALVVILINHEVIEREKTREVSLDWRPMLNLTVEVDVPSGMNITDVYEVGGTYARVKFNKVGTRLRLAIGKLDLTRQFVLTTDQNDYHYDGDGDGISDIREITVTGTHPAVSNVEHVHP